MSSSIWTWSLGVLGSSDMAATVSHQSRAARSWPGQNSPGGNFDRPRRTAVRRLRHPRSRACEAPSTVGRGGTGLDRLRTRGDSRFGVPCRRRRSLDDIPAVTADFLVEQISLVARPQAGPDSAPYFAQRANRSTKKAARTQPVGFTDNERFTRATQLSKVSTR